MVTLKEIEKCDLPGFIKVGYVKEKKYRICQDDRICPSEKKIGYDIDKVNRNIGYVKVNINRICQGE